MLFDKFDEDGSGAWDAREIAELYRHNDINLSVEQVKKLFGDDVYLTLENFIKLSRSKDDLLRYFNAFKGMHNELVETAKIKRNYVPSTFEEMMMDFGHQAERREVKERIRDAKCLLLENDIGKKSVEELQ